MNKLLSRKEYEVLIQNQHPDHCLLCELEKQIVLGSSEHWLWIACLSPYWRYHTLFIPRKHSELIEELSGEELKDFGVLYKKVKTHFLSLKLRHKDGKVMDQFILMLRIRENINNGSTYYKPKHLHIHFGPDREGVSRFKIDETAVKIDITNIALPSYES